MPAGGLSCRFHSLVPAQDACIGCISHCSCGLNGTQACAMAHKPVPWWAGPHALKDVKAGWIELNLLCCGENKAIFSVSFPLQAPYSCEQQNRGLLYGPDGEFLLLWTEVVICDGCCPCSLTSFLSLCWHPALGSPSSSWLCHPFQGLFPLLLA